MSSVVFVTVDYPPGPVGGAEHQAALQAVGLHRRGWAVRVVCPKWRDRATEVLDEIEVTRLSFCRWRTLRGVSYGLRLAWYLWRNRRTTDVVHVHLAGAYADVAAIFGRCVGTPVYVKVAAGGVSGEVTRRRKLRRPGRWLGLRLAARVQALSDEIQDELVHYAGVPSTSIVRIPNGVDSSRFRPPTEVERRAARAALGLSDDETVFVFSARFAHYKGAADVVAAWNHAALATASLLLVGTYDTEDRIPRVEETDSLRVLGWHEAPERVLHAADIYVHAAHADGMSNSLLEAQACGLPVIAARSGASRGFLRDDDVLFFSTGNAPDLARCLRKLKNDEALRGVLRTKSRELVMPLSDARIVRMIEEQYVDLLTNPVGGWRSTPS